MAAWTVGLGGNEADLVELAKSFKGPDLLISKKDRGYELASSEFLATDDEAQVREKAERVVESVMGASRLAFSLLGPITVAWVGHTGSDGHFRTTVTVSETMTMRATVSMTVTRGDGRTEHHNQADIVPAIVSRALTIPKVREVMALLAKSDSDWVNLYRIFEVVADDVGGLDTIAKNGWASKAVLRNFKHTANSPGAVGHQARHGVDESQPPQKAMPLRAATALIHEIVKHWLKTK